MHVPILQQGSCLIASVQAVLTDADLISLRDRLVEDVALKRAKGVILDVSGMDVIDSFAVRTLRDLAQMIRLRGAETIIVGIQPEIASAMVQFGLTLKGITTALDLEEGIACLTNKVDDIEER